MARKTEYKKGNLIVQKYGGTSVENPSKILEIAQYVKSYWKEDLKLIIVLSAMGKETNRLIRLAKEVSPNPSPRELDHLLQTGEVVTASLLSMALNHIKVPAISLNAAQIGLITSREHGQAKIKTLKNKSFVKNLLKEYVIVVTGFQGVSENGFDITTLGRGGSDATAVALAALLNAVICEIYTDVDGVFTVDPRLVPNAQKIKQISYDSMITMAAAGAGVLMDRSAKIAQTYNVVLKVMLSPSIGKSDGGTLVTAMGNVKNLEEAAYLCGIAIKKDIGVINILNVLNKPGQAARIFECFKGINIIEDAQVQGVNTAPISILLEDRDVDQALAHLRNIDGLKIESCKGLVAVTLIDPLMKEAPGYSYRITSALGQSNVNIEVKMTSQISITMGIKEGQLKKAVLALAKEFELVSP